MCTSPLCESRYRDPFFRDLVRRINFLVSLAEHCEIPARFLAEVRQALEDAETGRAGVPTRE